MQVLVVGLGSMGKRRIRDLQKLSEVKQVRGLDFREDRRTEVIEKYGLQVSSTIDDALEHSPDVIVVSTPPDKHMEYAQLAAREGCHFFVEASVVDDGITELLSLMKGKDIVGVPSCTMRFHENVKFIRELLLNGELGEGIGFNYHMGQYLPDWHPYEDYRNFYVSRADTAATREMVCFELVWLSWLFGLPTEVSCITGNLSTLEIEAPDIYQLLMKFPGNNMGSLMIDVISRTPYRFIRMISEKGVLEWSGPDNGNLLCSSTVM